MFSVLFNVLYDMILCKVYFIRFYTCHVFMPIMIVIFVIIYIVISLLCIYIHLIVICRLIVFCTNVDFNCNLYRR